MCDVVIEVVKKTRFPLLIGIYIALGSGAEVYILIFFHQYHITKNPIIRMMEEWSCCSVFLVFLLSSSFSLHCLSVNIRNGKTFLIMLRQKP